jgi:deoxyribodipyrimidine photo-lyase
MKSTTSNQSTALVWFRRDLRLLDNPALEVAATHHHRVVPVYVHQPDDEQPWSPGAASRWWLHHSLQALADQLQANGLGLHIISGEPGMVLEKLSTELGADAVYWNRCYEPQQRVHDEDISKRLRNAGLQVKTFNASLLFDPWQIERKDGGAYRVFTPYHRACLRQGISNPTESRYKIFDHPSPAKGMNIDALDLVPYNNWWKKLEPNWTPGEASALRSLDEFIANRLDGYVNQRDMLAEPATSRLSPHLHFGEISPRVIWYRLESALHDVETGAAHCAAVEAFQRQLIWRDFAHHLLYHFPQSSSQALNTRYADFPWEENDELLMAWQSGRTGIPLVDAGMRELWQTGTMHNRARMITASFLSKNLNISWLHGARWFWDTLVDADLANNTFGWQWAAGCGADAAPYFRIFNPARQGERFDAEGNYVRRWLPELADLRSRYIHQPWLAPLTELKQAGVSLGENYPRPIVDLSESRTSAIQRYNRWRNQTFTQLAS